MNIVLIEICFVLIGSISSNIQNMSISNNANRAMILSIYAMMGDIISATVNPFIGMVVSVSLAMSFMICTGISIIIFSFLIFILME